MTHKYRPEVRDPEGGGKRWGGRSMPCSLTRRGGLVLRPQVQGKAGWDEALCPIDGTRLQTRLISTYRALSPSDTTRWERLHLFVEEYFMSALFRARTLLGRMR